jgi:hypothetical protein
MFKMIRFIESIAAIIAYASILIFSGYLFGLGILIAVKDFIRQSVSIVPYKPEGGNGDGPDLPPGLKGYYQ